MMRTSPFHRMSRLLHILALCLVLSPVCDKLLIAEPAARTGEHTLLHNGSFNLDENRDGLPDAWYNFSRARREMRDGNDYCMSLHADKPEQDARLSQSFSLDGRSTTHLALRCDLRCDNILPGDWIDHLPCFTLHFLDSDYKPAGSFHTDSWYGTAAWHTVQYRVEVPDGCREATLTVSLNGATGTLRVDDVQLQSVEEDPCEFIQNGHFQYGDQRVFGWTTSGDTALSWSATQDDKDSHFLRLPDEEAVAQDCDLKDLPVSYLKVAFRTRTNHARGRCFLQFNPSTNPLSDSTYFDLPNDTAGQWESQTATLPVPSAIPQVIMWFLSLSGTIDIDDVSVHAFTKEHQSINAWREWKPDRTGWFPFVPLTAIRKGSALDIGNLLNTSPVGKHGFIFRDRRKFEDGTPTRFYGVTLNGPACFPDAAQATELARRLRSLGINLIRLYGLDTFESPEHCLIDASYRDTTHFSAENLKRLDYFIDQLKRNGIYSVLSVNSHRQFRENDGIADFQHLPPGGGLASLITPEVRQMQLDSVLQLLSRRNVFTGKQYLRDPAIVGIEWNLRYPQQGTDLIPESYHGRFASLWNDWLRAKYQTSGRLAAAWSNERGESELGKTESLTQGNVLLPATMPSRESARNRDLHSFFADLEFRYFEAINRKLSSAGLKNPVIPQFNDLERDTFVSRIDASQPKPSSLIENPLLVVSSAGLKKSPVAMHGMVCCDPEPWGDHVPGTLPTDTTRLSSGIINANPQVFMQWPAAALNFHRHEVESVMSSDYSPVTLDDTAGIFTIATPLTECVGGFIGGKEIALKQTTFQCDSDYAIIALSSLTKQPLSRSSHILITTVSRCEPKGMTYTSPLMRALNSPGSRPLLMQPVEANVLLQREDKRPIKVYALKTDGSRKEEVKADLQKGTLRIRIDGKHAAVHYELVSQPQTADQ